MPLPLTDTIVTYPAGSVLDRASVLALVVRDDTVAVITDATPFHPVEPRWPDQGTDLGTLTCAAGVATIVEATIGATDGTDLFVGGEVTVRRGTPGWAFVVAHLIAVDAPRPVAGEIVTLTADGVHRAALSAGHTACHVAALALNAVLADRWRQPLGSGGRIDGLGNPDFDQLAITSSAIHPYGATDTYRVGKSLRKRGFNSTGLDSVLPGVADRANDLLAGWVAAGAPIELEVTGPRLTDLRTWVCRLPEGTQRIPCGGTHLSSLQELRELWIALSFDAAAGVLAMTTVAMPAKRF
jgi:alanyl-tRNA synthetase